MGDFSQTHKEHAMRAHSAALSVFATAIAAPNNRWTPPKPLLLCRDSHVLFLCFCNISIYPTFPKQLCVVRRLPVFVGVLNADGAVGYTIIDFVSILYRF
jgi:hypothetical protein